MNEAPSESERALGAPRGVGTGLGEAVVVRSASGIEVSVGGRPHRLLRRATSLAIELLRFL